MNGTVMEGNGRTAVVAVGGNVILASSGPATIAEQFEAAEGLAAQVAGLVQRGWRVVLTHGNGPQVGFILRRSDLVADIAPELPRLALDMCVADSQGSLGYILGSTLQSALNAVGSSQQVAAMLTHTLVDTEDAAFANPTKPIGSFYDEAKAKELAAAQGWVITEDAGRGWRRLVPSPKPIRILEQSAIKALTQAGFLVVAVGGGGIPVVEEADGHIRGVEAVIDKDFASALLATELGADMLCITTGVDRVAINFGRPDQRDLDVIDVEEARRHLADGQFPPGSMGPKVEAALQYLEAGGKDVLITSPDRLTEAIDGATGTRVTAQSA